MSFAASAQTYENFNSRDGVALNQVKTYLVGQCWIFKNADVNSGFTPGIDGDGAIVLGPATSPTQETGFYTPVLHMWGETESDLLLQTQWLSRQQYPQMVQIVCYRC